MIILKYVILIFNHLRKDDEPEGCKICRYGVDIMWNHLRRGDNHEIQNLNKFCDASYIEDREICLLGIETWWPTLAGIIYGENTIPYVCHGLNIECNIFKYMLHFSNYLEFIF